MYNQNTPPPPPQTIPLPTEPKRNKTTFITILALGLTTLIFMFGMIIFAFQASAAQKNFDDQVDVTRELIQGYDALNTLDVDTAEWHLDRAMNKQEAILDRVGEDALIK